MSDGRDDASDPNGPFGEPRWADSNESGGATPDAEMEWPDLESGWEIEDRNPTSEVRIPGQLELLGAGFDAEQPESRSVRDAISGDVTGEIRIPQAGRILYDTEMRDALFGSSVADEASDEDHDSLRSSLAALVREPAGDTGPDVTGEVEVVVAEWSEADRSVIVDEADLAFDEGDYAAGDVSHVDDPGIDEDVDLMTSEVPEIDQLEVDQLDIGQPEMDGPEVDEHEVGQPEIDRPEVDQPGPADHGDPYVAEHGVADRAVDVRGVDDRAVDVRGVDVGVETGQASDGDGADHDDQEDSDDDVEPLGDVAAILIERIRNYEPGVSSAWVLALGFATLFGWFAVRQHDAFGTYAFDLGIYDQAIWLASRGREFITVRGLSMWAHHLNIAALAYVPFYWFGAGPRFLLVTQAAALGIGAVPVFLLARRRLESGWFGLLFAVLYLLYPPVEWLNYVGFHPEALAVTALLFAWWFAVEQRWRAFVIAACIAIATREDVALVLIVMGGVIWWLAARDNRRGKVSDGAFRRIRGRAVLLSAFALAYYAVAIGLILPAFNRWSPPFYIGAYFGEYGANGGEVVFNLVRRPDRIAAAAAQPDRLRFYRDLVLPWGGLPVLGLPQVLMAVPQLLASTLANFPYARQIQYQYTSVMIAPITIAAIAASGRLATRRSLRLGLAAWLIVCGWTSNTAWSPAPWAEFGSTWLAPTERSAVLADAVAVVPPGASVTADFRIVPHLTHRDQVYDWPNPWRESNWGIGDGYLYPSPDSVDWVILETDFLNEDEQALLDSEVKPDFDLVFDQDSVIVLRRRQP